MRYDQLTMTMEHNLDVEVAEVDTRKIISAAERLMILDDTSRWVRTLEKEKPDMLYFLDKSARPLSWLLRRVYPSNSELPEFRFLNIGAEKEADFDLLSAHSTFPELDASKKFHPQKIMIIDEKTHSGESLERASRIVRKLYGLGDEQILTYSVLSSFPKWYGKQEMIGIYDSPNSQYDVLSQPVIDIEISATECILLEKLKTEKIDMAHIDDELVNILLPEQRKKELSMRLKLMLDKDRHKAILVNPNLSDWDTLRKRNDYPLRSELAGLAINFSNYYHSYDEFSEIETEVIKNGVDQEKLSAFFDLEWNEEEHIFKCSPEKIVQLADKIESKGVNVGDGMYVYYLIKYNRLHPDDWGDFANYYNPECQSLNYLAAKLLANLPAP